MKKIFFILPAALLLSVSQSRAQGRPSLTEEQKSCLDSQIGTSGERPSREKMQQAFAACGLKAPKGGPGGPPGGLGGKGPGHILTDEQRTCLDGKVGAAHSESRPSREEMKAAMEACGIAKPEKRKGFDEGALKEDLQSLTERYAQSESDEEKQELREEIKQLFYGTQDESLKKKVRQFLKENPPAVAQNSSKKASSKTAGLK